jgi:hypothetical protein
VYGWLIQHRVTAAVAIVAAATGASGTALAFPPASPAHVVTLPAAGRTQATLNVTSGTPVLRISAARLGGTLLRVSTPAGAPVQPVLSGSRPIVLSLTGAAGGPGQTGTVDVLLNAAVLWSIDLAAGTQRTDVDMRGGKVAVIAVTAGSDILDMTLPRPAGTVPLLFGGGASQFRLTLPGGVPARVVADGGAGYLTLDGQTLTGVAGGTVLATPGWATARARFEIDAIAGVSRLTVLRW